MKKLCLVITWCFIMTGILGCSQADTVLPSDDLKDTSITMDDPEGFITTVHASEEFVTFEEAIGLSDCAAVAEFVAVHDKGDYVEFEFYIDEEIYGYLPEQTIYLFSRNGTATVEGLDYTYSMDKNKYIIGQKYVLIMIRKDLLIFDYPRYQLLTNIYIPLNDAELSTMYGQPISALEEFSSGESQDMLRKIREINDALPVRAEQSFPEYSRSDQVVEIVDDTDLVLEVTIERLQIEGSFGSNGNTYACSILQILKGNAVNTDENGTILVTLLKGSVEVGQNYIIMVNKISDNSSIYTLSSKKSVVWIGDSDGVHEVEEALEQLQAAQGESLEAEEELEEELELEIEEE